MKVTWRQLPTVLFEDEVLDKAFSRARKAADRVEDPNRVFRTRKQMTRMVQTAADIIHTMLNETVQTWPSLDQSPQFDVAMIEACVGTDDYRHHLSMLQWGASQVQRIATQNNRKIIRTARIELMHEARREAYGRIGSIMGRVGPSLKWLNESREILKALPQIDSSLPVIVVCGAPNVGKSAFISGSVCISCLSNREISFGRSSPFLGLPRGFGWLGSFVFFFSGFSLALIAVESLLICPTN